MASIRAASGARERVTLGACIVPLVCALSCLLGVCSVSRGADWPQYGGPNRNGISTETGLARSWPEAGPKVLWTVPLGKGFGGMAVRDGEVFLLDRVGSKQDVLRCFELATGKQLWQAAFDAPGTPSPSGSRATPAVDERFVFSVGPFGHFRCVDRKTHRVVWEKHFGRDFGAKQPRWGIAQNPLLYGDWVIVSPQGEKAGVAAFEKATGRVVWASPYLPGMASEVWQGSYSSPVIVRVGEADHVVVLTAKVATKEGELVSKGQVAGISAKDGSVLWSYTGWQSEIPIPYPAVLDGGRVFATGAYGGGSSLIQVSRAGDGFAVREVFKTMECGSQVQAPIAYGGHIYVCSNGKERKEGFMCLGLDGQVKWHTTNSKFVSKAKAGLPNLDRGNFLIADGLIFILDGKQGDLRLLEASPRAYTELAVAKGLLGEKGGRQLWAPMALSGGKLLIRDHACMKCLDVRKP